MLVNFSSSIPIPVSFTFIVISEKWFDFNSSTIMPCSGVYLHELFNKFTNT